MKKMVKREKIVKYDSDINILGGVPDYAVMLDFISEYTGQKEMKEIKL